MLGVVVQLVGEAGKGRRKGTRFGLVRVRIIYDTLLGSEIVN